MPGPIRKPTNLKLVDGSKVNKTRLANEPKPDLQDDLSYPPNLPEAAWPIWKRLAPKFRKAKLLSEIDTDALTILCSLLTQYYATQQELDGQPLLTVPREGVQPQPHPLLIVQSMLNKQIIRYLNEFGATPAARSRIQLDIQGDLFKDLQPQSKTSEFFK
jgi:P27 family predicted phage terminase small subunit